MAQDHLSLFLEFNDAVPEMGRHLFPDKYWVEDFQSRIDGRDWGAIDAICRKMLDGIVVNKQLVNLYSEVDRFQSDNIGSGYRYYADHPFIEKTITLLKDTIGIGEPTAADMTTFVERVKAELQKEVRASHIIAHLNKHEKEISQFRFQKLEKSVDTIEQTASWPTTELSKTTPEFTHVRQALAIQYLFAEGFGVTHANTMHLIALAHLLSAKPAPLDPKTGAWNFKNSGLKSAFTKSKSKSGPHQLADLRFVQRLFQPLRGLGNGSIDRILGELEKDIDRAEEKLKKSRD